MKIYNFFKTFSKAKYIILPFLFFPLFVSAGDDPAMVELKKVGSGALGPYQDLGVTGISTIVGTVIQALLGLLGVIFLVLILYAGYNWMIARGEEEKVEKAKDTLTRATIGLIITVGAYAISYFVIDKLIINGGIIK